MLSDLAVAETPYMPLLSASRSAETDADRQALVAECRHLVELRKAHMIRRNDPRLGVFLQKLGVSGRNALEMAEQIIAAPFSVRHVQRCLSALRELRQQIAVILAAKLEDDLRALLAVIERNSARNAEIAAQYLGCDGAGGLTLEQVGRHFGLTRERVRQICKRVGDRLKERRPFVPALDVALELVAKQVPAPAAEIERELKDAGIAGGAFRLEGLRETATILGRECPFVLPHFDGNRLALPPGAGGATQLVAAVARRSTAHWGLTSVADIAARVSELAETNVDEAMVRHIVDIDRTLEWLDRDGGWFWAPAVSRNRLINQIDKVLSVAEQIHVSELRVAVGRHHRMNGFAPPRRVLLELCRHLPRYRVVGDTITADPPLDWRELLADVERTLTAVLKEEGPIMGKGQLERRCLELGVNRSTFWAYLDYSPVVARFSRGVYGIPGATAPPGVIESLVPKRSQRPTRVLQDFGWLPDGRVWFAYKLSEGSVGNGVVTLPVGMRQFVDGSFVLKTADSTRVGTFVVSTNSGWGLGPLFRRCGAEAGDYLVLVIDLKLREVEARLGDEGLLDQLDRDDGTTLETRLEERANDLPDGIVRRAQDPRPLWSGGNADHSGTTDDQVHVHAEPSRARVRIGLSSTDTSTSQVAQTDVTEQATEPMAQEHRPKQHEPPVVDRQDEAPEIRVESVVVRHPAKL
jgi:hypothetical protein